MVTATGTARASKAADRYTCLYAVGIIEAERVRQVPAEKYSLAEAEAFCRAYNEGMALHDRVAVILPPGTVRTIGGALAKAKPEA
jgi:hypothetical protein